MEVRDGLLDLIAKNDRRAIEHDDEWDSPCRVGNPDDDGMITWQPVTIDPPPDFSAIEEILGGPMHPDAKQLFGSCYAGPVEGRHSGEPVSLMTVWNSIDLRRRLDGIRQHVELCRAEGMRFSIPVANTDSDYLFAIDNATGEVLLGEVGYPLKQIVAPSLAQFLSELSRKRTGSGP